MALVERLVALAAVVFSNVIVEVEGLALQTGSRQEPQQQMQIENPELVGTSSKEDRLALDQSDEQSQQMEMMPKREVWFLLYGAQELHEYMHLPIIYTLREAFQKAGGINLNVVWAIDDTCELERRLEAIAGNGPKPVVIVNHWFYELRDAASCEPASYGDLLRKLSDISYMIFYNDEPTVRTGQEGRFLQRTAVKYKVKEVWSYSKYMMSLTETSLKAADIISRYMPAGCAQEMDFGVLNNVPGAPPRNYSQVGFLGKWRDRPAAVAESLLSGFGDRIHRENHANSEGALRSYLTSCPLVQINPHSERNPTGQAMESFRISLLIMNGACVLSEPVHPLDEQLYEDVVQFEQVGRFHEAWQAWKDNPQAVTACNQKARQNFCTNFVPVKMLRKSGFLAWMQKVL